MDGEAGPAQATEPEVGDQVDARARWTRSAGGKHVVKMTKPGERPVTLPMHKGQDYSAGLTRSILKAAGLD